MLSAVAGSVLEEPDAKACILAHRDELTTQNREKVGRVNPGVATSVFDAKEKSWAGRATFAMGGAQRRAGLVRVFGALMVATSLLVVTGADTAVEAAVTGLLPAGWSGAIASVEEVPAVQEGLDVLRRSATSAPLTGSGPVSPPTQSPPLPAAVHNR